MSDIDDENEVGQYDNSDEIVRSKTDVDNLCMFESMYNSLRTHELRKAFAGGISGPDYTKEFVAFCAKQGHPPVIKNSKNEIQKMTEKEKKIHNRRNREGYDMKDITGWLNDLKRRKLIKSYIFVSWDHFRLINMLHPNRQNEKKKVLLCGYAVTENQRKSLNRFVWKGPKEDREVTVYRLDGTREVVFSKDDAVMNNTQLMKLCNMYDSWSQSMSSSSTHGVVLSQEDDGEIYLYDNGLKVRRRVTRSVKSVAERIVGVWKKGARIFDISLTEDIHKIRRSDCKRKRKAKEEARKNKCAKVDDNVVVVNDDDNDRE